MSLCLLMLLAAPSVAQDEAKAVPTGTTDYEEIKGLLDSIQTRIDKMNKRAAEADAALKFLDDQVLEAIGRLSSRQDENTALRQETVGLNDKLGIVNASRAELATALALLGNERDQSVGLLEERVAVLTQQLELEQQALIELRQTFDFVTVEFKTTVEERDTTRNRLEAANLQLAETAKQLSARQDETERLSVELAALGDAHAKFEDQAAAGARRLDDAQTELVRTRGENESLAAEVAAERQRATALETEMAQLRDQRRIIEAQLGEHVEQIALAKQQLEERDSRLRRLAALNDKAENAMADERAGAEEARRRVAELTRQLGEVSRQLGAVNDLLVETEDRNTSQQAAIIDLERKLNRALVAKVEELAKYRSDFFGRLRQVLDRREDIRVVGDRFVFQAEVLFNSSEADLEPAGRERLIRLAKTLNDIAETIPPDIDWVLRVDGHTDVRPIATEQFPSNWELSTARATSVVKFLIDQAIPAQRLVAAGFGEHHPIDPRVDEIAYRRNRRIEFKLTQR